MREARIKHRTDYNSVTAFFNLRAGKWAVSKNKCCSCGIVKSGVGSWTSQCYSRAKFTNEKWPPEGKANRMGISQNHNKKTKSETNNGNTSYFKLCLLEQRNSGDSSYETEVSGHAINLYLNRQLSRRKRRASSLKRQRSPTFWNRRPSGSVLGIWVSSLPLSFQLHLHGQLVSI